MSKNATTIDQLNLACKHISEMMKIGMTRNHAIRLLELIADVYARGMMDGKAKVWKAEDVPRIQWSLAAKGARKERPRTPAGRFLRVEHGTPRRQFALKILDRWGRRPLTARAMKPLVEKFWRIAVITHEEDRRIRRKPEFDSPQERWAHYGIRFPKGSPNSPV